MNIEIKKSVKPIEYSIAISELEDRLNKVKDKLKKLLKKN